MSKMNISWSDRFALMDHFKPSDEQACAAFGLTKDELDTARSMAAAGTFRATKNLDIARYAHVFTTDGSSPVATVPPTPGPTSVAKPESATKRVKVPQKRGRKGDKIAIALQAVPLTSVPVDQFIAQYGVSLAVLRQSKRFMTKLDPAVAAKIGKVNVRQDKATKQLVIWREAV